MAEESIPAINRYCVDGDGWSMEPIEDGSWVRYEDHVAAMELVQLRMKKLEQEMSKWKEMLTKSVHSLVFQEKQIAHLKTRRN